MKLFEISSPEGAKSILAVIQGLANNKKIPSELPFPAFKNYINGDELGIGTPKALVAFKNAVDPTGDVIKDILDNGTVILNTDVQGQAKDSTPTPAGGSTSVDQMASQAAKKAISPKF
jgi:hypothetical protein